MNDTDKTIGKRNSTQFGNMMFDRKNDPLELKNIAASPEHAGELSKLEKQLSQWETQFPVEVGKAKFQQ